MNVSSCVQDFSFSSVPLTLWNYYLKYLWYYDSSSWVARISSTIRVLAFLLVLPVAILGMLVCLAYCSFCVYTLIKHRTYPHMSLRARSAWSMRPKRQPPKSQSCPDSSFLPFASKILHLPRPLLSNLLHPLPMSRRPTSVKTILMDSQTSQD